MQIGEFAKLCNTKISVLRYYDKEGLLLPDYIDRFTSYRYYSKNQMETFVKISALKKAHFSLSEIKEILTKSYTNHDILHLLENKKRSLLKTIENVEQAKTILLGGKTMVHVTFHKTDSIIQARSTAIDGEKLHEAYESMENALILQGYQRISSYTVHHPSSSNLVELHCNVIKLKEEFKTLHEDINLPFVDDVSIIGKWKVIGEYAVKEDFFKNRLVNKEHFGDLIKEIFFLPEGEKYWCYGWTKGKLLIDTGDSSYANEYTVETYNEKRYMFIKLKSYNFCHGGIPTILVLYQLDNIPYSRQEIARKDSLDMPFIPDEKVLGKWKSYCFCRTKEEFTADNIKNFLSSNSPSYYFKSIEFFENGHCTSVYEDEIISGDAMQFWTKGYVLRKYNSTACNYEIKTIDNRDFLIMEWKSGDYRWGGLDTDYYVFVRV